MMILYNGKIGARQYRLLIAVIDGMLVAYRPYVGWYFGGGGVIMTSPEEELEKILKEHTDRTLTMFMEEFGDMLSEYQIAVLVASFMQDTLNELDGLDTNWTVTLTEIDKEEEEGDE